MHVPTDALYTMEHQQHFVYARANKFFLGSLMHTLTSDRQSTTQKTSTNWWATQFGTQYLQTLSHNFTNSTQKQIRFIDRIASLSIKDTILDVGCGHGRHSIGLASLGYRVVGIDYSRKFIQMAINTARKAHVNPIFKQQDMRRLNYDAAFDVVLSIFTSFGYFDHHENLHVLHNMCKALKNHGRLVLDVLNADMIFRDIKRDGKQISPTVYIRKYTHKKGKYIFVDTDSLNEKTQVTHLHRLWRYGKQSGKYDFYILRYTLQQLIRMISEEGFAIHSVFGDYNGSSWNPTTKRTIIVAIKTNRNPLINKCMMLTVQALYAIKQLVWNTIK